MLTHVKSANYHRAKCRNGRNTPGFQALSCRNHRTLKSFRLRPVSAGFLGKLRLLRPIRRPIGLKGDERGCDWMKSPQAPRSRSGTRVPLSTAQ